METNKTDEKVFTAVPETKLHFLDYWRIIRIRKTVILAVFLLVALTTTVVTYLLPPTYSSMVKISIEQDLPDVPSKEGNVWYRPAVDPFFIQTEFQRIQSKPVLYQVIEELNLRETWGQKYKQSTPLTKENAYKILKNSIDVSQSHNTTLVEIHAYSDNKDEAATIAQKVADVYAKVRNEARSKLTTNGLANLHGQLQAKERLISNQVQKVNGLRAQLQIHDYEAFGNQPSPTLPQETLRQLSSTWLDAQNRFVQASNRYVKLAALERNELKDAAPLQVPGDTRLADLINQENAVAQKLADLRGAGLLGENNPEVKSKTELLKEIPMNWMAL